MKRKFVASLLVIAMLWIATISLITTSSTVNATEGTNNSTRTKKEATVESSKDNEHKHKEKITIDKKKNDVEKEKTEEAKQVDIEDKESEPEPEESENTELEEDEWKGEKLTAWKGVVEGPSGLETYYNLPMDGVVQIMRELDYNDEEYYYWEREDGCKMLGDYIIVAANLNIRPRGTILPTSLGKAIVCDTGTFADYNETQIDIAVNW